MRLSSNRHGFKDGSGRFVRREGWLVGAKSRGDTDAPSESGEATDVGASSAERVEAMTEASPAALKGPAKPASQVRMFLVPNKLREKLLKSGGARAIELLARADANLEFLRPRCLNQISDLIAEIANRYGAAKRKGDEDFDGLYSLSAKIIDISTPVADLEIDRAAFSLCELVDRCDGVGQWDWPSVDVHIDALMLLRLDAGTMPAEARQQIFNGLQKLNKRLPSLSESQAATEQASQTATAADANGDATI